MDTQQTSLRIPTHIYDLAKEVAASEDRTLANLIVRAMRLYVKDSASHPVPAPLMYD
jgi:hypothetical protein